MRNFHVDRLYSLLIFKLRPFHLGLLLPQAWGWGDLKWQEDVVGKGSETLKFLVCLNAYPLYPLTVNVDQFGVSLSFRDFYVAPCTYRKIYTLSKR